MELVVELTYPALLIRQHLKVFVISFLIPDICPPLQVIRILLRIDEGLSDCIIVPAQQISLMRQFFNLLIQFLNFFVILRTKSVELSSQRLLRFLALLLEILDLLVILAFQVGNII